MTRERALELAQNLDASISGGEWDRTDIAMVADAILAAIAEERYACAKIAEDYCDENGDFIGGRIRARN